MTTKKVLELHEIIFSHLGWGGVSPPLSMIRDNDDDNDDGTMTDKLLLWPLSAARVA